MRVPTVIGRRTVAVAVAVALVAVVVTAVWAYRRHRADTMDAAAVWCLTADRRPALVQAARALGRVHPESTVERVRWSGGSGGAERWRSERPADFARTCRALIGAEQRPSGGGSSPWSGFTPALLLAVVSAALAAWFSRRSAVADARRVEAEALRAAARAYRAAVERLVRELEQRRPGMAPDDGEVQDRQLELATRLRAVSATYRDWSLPRTLGETLDREPLGAGMVARWTARPPQDRPGWAAETRGALGRLEADVAQVAEAMREPGPFRTRMPAGRR
ncbi:hypothetical protein [Micromonospora sp. NPDC023956]|uniref:hypothetical protein n=1 Tax=Micromonospora sp. NPDC023956 TaxID=3155722 RepID=UPI0033DFB6D4